LSEIDGINPWIPIQPNPPGLSRANSPQKSHSPPQNHHSDRVEISNVARFLSQIASMPDIRPEKVEALRNALFQGAYDINANLSEALEKLLDENQI